MRQTIILDYLIMKLLVERFYTTNIYIHESMSQKFME